MKKTLTGFVVVDAARGIDAGTFATDLCVSKARMTLKTKIDWTTLEQAGHKVSKCQMTLDCGDDVKDNPKTFAPKTEPSDI